MPMPNAAPNRNPQRAPQRRRLNNSVSSDRYYVEPGNIPPGMSYEFKRQTFAGKEDVRHQAVMAGQGFTPVPASRHPEIVGVKAATENPNAAIIVDGLMLMERPKELEAEAKAEDKENAHAQVRNQMKSLRLTPDGNLPRKAVKTGRKYDIAVPESDDNGE